MKGRVVLLDTLQGRRAAALMVDGRLEDLLIDPPEGATPPPGAIFRARTERRMKGQGGITLDLGDGRRGYLRRAQDVRPGQTLLVQVASIAEPGKAVPVTPKLLFKSRYAIVTPGAPGLNVSRSIRDDDIRDHLLELAHVAMEARIDSAMDGRAHGLILRSASATATVDDITSDINAMCDLAETILADTDGPPEWLYEGDDAHTAAWRDWSEPAPDEVISSDGCFAEHGVIEAASATLDPAVPLGGGAVAYVEPTRALVAIDVNTGGDTSLAAGLKANLALARTLPKALRIKGLGGLLTCELAPMPKKDRRAFEAALRKAFRSDGAEVVLAGWTPLGLYEVQKKRDRIPLSQVWPSGL